MRSINRIFSGRKGDDALSAYQQTPLHTSNDDHKPKKSKSFWRKISPKSVSAFFSRSSNRSGEESKSNPSHSMNSLTESVSFNLSLGYIVFLVSLILFDYFLLMYSLTA